MLSRKLQSQPPKQSPPLAIVSAPFDRFANSAAQVAATTKRLEKAALVGALLGDLSDGDLVAISRYLAGYTFPLYDQRTTQVGGSTLVSAIVAITGTNPDDAMSRLVTIGDLGDLAGELFAASENVPTLQTLTIADVAVTFDRLASTQGAKAKAQIVFELLSKAMPNEARYLVKLLAGDLRIGLQEGAVEDAIARWAGVNIARVKWANMLIGDIGQTALLARHGDLDSARMRLFHPLKFMLASPAPDLAEVTRLMPESFIVEDKYDGIRAQAHVLGSPSEDDTRGIVSGNRRVALFSRTLDDITPSFPDLVFPLASLIPEASSPEFGLVLDGEILPMLGDKILKFRELQARLGRKVPNAELIAHVPVKFVAYDILYLGDGLLINEPFVSRRMALESLPNEVDGFIVAPSRSFQDALELDAEFEASRSRGNEGLMVKDPGSTYKPGRRGREWLKIKRAIATLDVVVTAVEVGHGRRSNVLSDYTFAVRASESDPTLLNVGKAYSGLTDAEISKMSEWFREHTLQEFGHGRVRVVQPTIVIEVTFDLVQPSTRHKSGYALRFPRIVRLRPDKPADEIDTLQTVALLAGDSSA